MFDVFSEVKRHVSTSGKHEARITSLLFTLLKIAMLITTLACVTVTARNYIGENINCLTGYENQEHKAIETYCFISSTFTLIDLSPEASSHPGVGPIDKGRITPEDEKKEGEEEEENKDDMRRHAYYQWVPIVLALQAAVYYLPNLLWKTVDNGYYQQVMHGLDQIHIGGNVDGLIEQSASYFCSSLNTHTPYAIKFIMCEIVGFSVAIGNLFFTNTFLGGEFFYFGPLALKYLRAPAYDPNNPLNEIFPKVAKCTWHKFGPSGTLMTTDSMCVLPLNIVNEKTYIFLWVVYMAVAILTGIVLLFHFILLLVPSIRHSLLVFGVRDVQTKNRLQSLLVKCQYGDWFLLENFRKHMAYYSQWIEQLTKELKK